MCTFGSRPAFGIYGYYVEFYKNSWNVITPLTDLSDHVNLLSAFLSVRTHSDQPRLWSPLILLETDSKAHGTSTVVLQVSLIRPCAIFHRNPKNTKWTTINPVLRLRCVLVSAPPQLLQTLTTPYVPASAVNRQSACCGLVYTAGKCQHWDSPSERDWCSVPCRVGVKNLKFGVLRVIHSFCIMLLFANIINVYLPLKSVLDAGVEVLFNKRFVIETDNRAFGVCQVW